MNDMKILFYTGEFLLFVNVPERDTALPEDVVSKKSITGWNETVSMRRWWFLLSVHSGFTIVSERPASGMLQSLI